MTMLVLYDLILNVFEYVEIEMLKKVFSKVKPKILNILLFRNPKILQITIETRKG